MLIRFSALLELYKPLSQKLGYFNEEYDNRIEKITDKIKKCLNDYELCIGIDRRLYKDNKINFGEKYSEIIKNFIKDKIEVEIIKVPIEKSIKYNVVGIREFEVIERKKKVFKRRNITDEVIN